jgi:hypothetical protein
VVCTSSSKPLDQERWRAAVADFPELAAPIQVSRDELPLTATLKVKRRELARHLQDRLEQQA